MREGTGLSLVYRIFHTPWNLADLVDNAGIEESERIHLSVEEHKVRDFWRVRIHARYWNINRETRIIQGKREVLVRKRLEFGCPHHCIDLHIQLYKELIEEAGLKIGQISYNSDGDGL